MFVQPEDLVKLFHNMFLAEKGLAGRLEGMFSAHLGLASQQDRMRGGKGTGYSRAWAVNVPTAILARLNYRLKVNTYLTQS